MKQQKLYIELDINTEGEMTAFSWKIVSWLKNICKQ